MPDTKHAVLEATSAIEARAVEVSVLRMRGADAHAYGRLSETFGVAWPIESNSMSGVVAWLGPQEWAIFDAPDAVSARVARACAGGNYHVAHVGPGRRVWRVQGGNAKSILARGASLDFDDRAFPVQSCAQTLFAQVHALIMRPCETRFNLLVDASYDEYLRQWFDLVSSESV